MAVAATRLAGARQAGSAEGQALQVALIRTCAGPLTAAIADENAVGHSPARLLARAGIDVRPSASRVGAVRAALGRPPRACRAAPPWAGSPRTCADGWPAPGASCCSWRPPE
jgi:hypothetical protein